MEEKKMEQMNRIRNHLNQEEVTGTIVMLTPDHVEKTQTYKSVTERLFLLDLLSTYIREKGWSFLSASNPEDEVVLREGIAVDAPLEAEAMELETDALSQADSEESSESTVSTESSLSSTSAVVATSEISWRMIDEWMQKQIPSEEVPKEKELFSIENDEEEAYVGSDKRFRPYDGFQYIGYINDEGEYKFQWSYDGDDEDLQRISHDTNRIGKWMRLRTIGDGNCLVHALLLLLSPMYRRLTGVQKSQAAKSYRAAIAADPPATMLPSEIELLGKDGFWLGEHEGQKIVRELGYDLMVLVDYEDGTQTINVEGLEETENNFLVLYNTGASNAGTIDSVHFEAVMPMSNY